MGELAVEGNFVCYLIIVVIFMGLGGAYRFGEILKSPYGEEANQKVMGPFFMRAVDHSRHQEWVYM